VQQKDIYVTGVTNSSKNREKDFMDVVISEVNDYLFYTNSMAPSARTQKSCEANMSLGIRSSTIGCDSDGNAVDDHTDLYSEKIVHNSRSN